MAKGPTTVKHKFGLVFQVIWVKGPRGPVDEELADDVVDVGVMLDEEVGVPGSVTYQTASQWRLPRAERGLTLVGVTRRALVGLGTVVTLVEALVAAGDGDAVVIGQVPATMSALLSERLLTSAG